MLDGARFADAHGFSAVWTPERHFHPFGGPYPNPAVTAAALATITERIRLRAGSVVAPLHDPIRVRAYPPAVQPELPIWLTSAGSTGTFKAAGAMGAGILTHLLGQDLPTLAGNIAEYRAALGGRAGKVALMLHTFVGADTAQVRAVVREPLKAYLASSTELFTGASEATGEDLDPALLEELLDLAFERYFTEGGLFGSVGHAATMVQRVREIGVDEIACLVDFGIPAGEVIDSLVHLDELRAASAV